MITRSISRGPSDQENLIPSPPCQTPPLVLPSSLRASYPASRWSTEARRGIPLVLPPLDHGILLAGGREKRHNSSPSCKSLEQQKANPPMSRTSTPRVQWKVHVPQDLALRIEARIYDPTKGKPKYAQRNTIIVALLEKYDRETPLPEWLREGRLHPAMLPEPQIP